MPLNRGASPSFHQTILNNQNTEIPTKESLYDQCINLVHNSARWVADEVTNLRAQLAAQTTGTAASLTGSVDLTTLTYGAGGDLDGLTFTVQANAGGAQVITFGAGVNAPSGPADVVTQIDNDVDGNITHVLNQNGTLTLGSATLGGGSTFQITSSASAAQILGYGSTYPAIAPAGTGAVSDGSTRMGVAAFGILWAGGPLRSLLEQLLTTSGAAMPKTGGTFTGAVTFADFLILSGSAGRLRKRTNIALATTGATVYVTADIFRVTTTSNAVYVLNETAVPIPQEGETIELQVRTSGDFAIEIRREGGGSNALLTVTSTGAGLKKVGALFSFVDSRWRLGPYYALGATVDAVTSSDTEA